MDSYLLGFGIFVTVLFLMGVFYSIKEFKEMEKHPEEFHREDDRVDTSI